VFHEDRKSFASPECHMQGLMPYLQSMGSLGIERRVDLWTSVYINSYAYSLRQNQLIDSRLPKDYNYLAYLSSSLNSGGKWDDCTIADAVFRFVPWLLEATSIRFKGRSDRFTLQFNAPFDSMQFLWNKVKALAAFYAAVAGCLCRGILPFAR
jgi:hypothetical protein